MVSIKNLKPTILYILEKVLVLSVNVAMKMKKIFKEKEWIEILKILGFIKNYYYFKNMSRENISQEFRLKEMNETRNYFIEKIMQNELIRSTEKFVTF